MARQFLDDTLIVASHNQGKVGEITAMLSPWAIKVEAAAERGLAEPEETGITYKDNAILKALAAGRAAGCPALADDSGFEVEAINNDPGLFSARWAGPERDFTEAMEKVHQAVIASGSDDRRCRFVCALSLAWPDGHHETVEGRIEGEMVWPPRGDRGFGYDPIFRPLGHDETFAEADPEWKDSVSHRGLAFAEMIKRCFSSTPRRHETDAN